MAQLRFNPVTKQWVVISKERGQNRNAFITKGTHADTPCPFCDKDGGINRKLRSLYTINLPESSAPALIVTPNRYPSLGIEGGLERKKHGLYNSVSAIGAHEIIIDSFKHGIDITGYTEDEINTLFTAFKWRIIDLEKDSRFRFISAFKNIGRQAGEIINHPHAQIIALPVIPENVKNSLNTAVEYYKNNERCIYCDMIAQEKHEKSRIIFENYEFIAFTPYVSEYPFEISIFPKNHESSFTSISESTIRQLADIVKEMFHRLSSVLGSTALTMALRLAPFDNNRPDFDNILKYTKDAFHWHIEIRPYVAHTTADKWASNISISPVSPEDAAKHLREVNQV